MPSNKEMGREAVSALATIAVVIGGVLALVFVIVVGSDRPGPYLGGVAGGGGLLCGVLFLARSQPAGAGENDARGGQSFVDEPRRPNRRSFSSDAMTRQPPSTATSLPPQNNSGT